VSLPVSRTPEQKVRKNELERARYARGGAESRRYQRERSWALLVERRELIAQIKMEHGCIDCGYRAHPAALHFDHRDPAVKSFTIAKSLGYGMDVLLAEIEKCDVRCANCHAIRSVREGHLGRPRIDDRDEGPTDEPPLVLFETA